MQKKNIIHRRILLIVLLALIIEIFICNMRTIQSLCYSESSWLDCNIKIEGGTINADTGAIICDDTTVTIVLSDIGRKIENLYIDTRIADDIVSPYTDESVKVKLEVGDESLRSGERVYMPYAEQYVMNTVPASRYIWFESYGEISSMRISLSSEAADSIVINDIVFNAKRPFYFSFIRFFLIIIILLIIYAFRPSSELWSIRVLEHRSGLIKVIVIFNLFLAVIAFLWQSANAAIVEDSFVPYQELSHALANGQLCLPYEPSEAVLMSDGKPSFWSSEDENVMFDYAFHNGKYYVYFGILPCLVFYLPLYMITGCDMPNHIPVVILAVLLITAMEMLIYEMIRAWFKNTSVAVFTVISGISTCALALPWCVSQPDSYTVTILSGMVLSVFGVAMWIRALYTDDHIHYGDLMKGAVLMAAVSLCRPNMLLYSVLLPIFFFTVRKKLRFFKTLIFVAVPYTMFAVVAMIYNYLRFGSVTDFGAEYNLTAQPVIMRTPFIPGLIVRGVYEYFLKFPRTEAKFPFLDMNWVSGEFGQGNNFFTEGVGGLIPLVPICFLIFIFPLFGHKFNREIKLVFGGFLILALIMMAFTSVYSGAFTLRYSMDFTAFFMAAVCMAVMVTEENISETGESIRRGVRTFYLLCFLYTFLFYGMMQLFLDARYPLYYGNTELFYKLYYGFMFW